jgi:cell division protein FtsQ
MSGTVALKRGQTRKPVKKAAKRSVASAPAPMVRLPVAAARLRRHVLAVFSVLLVAAGAVTLFLLGIPQRGWFETAQAASRAGFEVRHVEVTGVHQAPTLPVYAAVLDGPTNSMLLVDLDGVRDRLRALPWVADASVSRRLPDTLRVDITERVPVALWQYQHKLWAIDRTGLPLTSENLAQYAKLPLVVGAGANARAHDFLVMIAAQPALADKVDAATLVGNRRWDVRFKSGEVLALPEGDAAAVKAIASFAALNHSEGLLARGFARFDMRLPGKMTVRLRMDPGSAVAPQQHEVAV